MNAIATNTGNSKNLPARHEPVPDHQPHQDCETDEEIHEGDHHRRDRHDQARKIDLADEIGVADEAVRGIGQRGGKEAPGQHAGKDHQRVGRRAVRRQLGQLAEDDGEHHHRQERPDQRPGGPDHRLLVAHRDVAPSQDLKQLAVSPQVTPIVALGPARLDDQLVRHICFPTVRAEPERANGDRAIRSTASSRRTLVARYSTSRTSHRAGSV